MRCSLAVFACALVSLAVPRIAAAAPVWIGDFETGDLSQWEGTLNQQIDGVDYITIVDDVVAQGMYAARIELHNDAVWGNGLKRVELHHTPPRGRTADGATTFFAWSFYLPETLPVDPSQSTGYWETDSSYHQLLVWEIAGEQMTFATRYPQYQMQWQQDGVVTAQTWHRIAIRLLFSQDPAVGEVDVWFDGEQVVSGAQVGTLADENSAFTQLGLLRGAFEFEDVPVIYIDDAVEGDSLEDVHPDLEPAGTDSGSSTDADSSASASASAGSEGADSSGGVDPSTSEGGSAADSVTAGPSTGIDTADDGSGSSGSPTEDDGGSGCGCTTTREPRPTMLALLVALLAVPRRRRDGANAASPSHQR